MALGKYSTKSSPVERHVDMEQTGMNRGREDLGSRRGARDDAVESRERGEEEEECREHREAVLGCARVGIHVQACAGGRRWGGKITGLWKPS